MLEWIGGKIKDLSDSFIDKFSQPKFVDNPLLAEAVVYNKLWLTLAKIHEQLAAQAVDEKLADAIKCQWEKQDPDKVEQAIRQIQRGQVIYILGGSGVVRVDKIPGHPGVFIIVSGAQQFKTDRIEVSDS